MSQKVVPDGILDWLQSRDEASDKILFRRSYVDLCDGDHLAALIFGQLLYYHLPDHKGKGTKLRVYKDGAYWVAKKYDDWYEECRINKDTARKKIDRLKRTGLIRTDNFRFNGIKMLHLRIDFECMAARIAALNLGRPVRPAGSDREWPISSNRSDLTGRTGLIPQDKLLTETTAQITNRETTPQPSPSEGAFSISPGLNLSGPEADTSGTTDWLLITTRDDRTAAEAVSQLFPSDPNTPLVAKDVARKFVKRRRGILGGNSALLLARWFRHARFEGTVVPDWKRVRTFSELLDERILSPALAAVRDAAQERIEELESMEDLSNYSDLGAQQLGYLEKMIEPGIDLVAFCSSRTDLPACCVVGWRKQLPDLVDVHRTYRETILSALVEARYWVQDGDQNPAEVFGISHDEIRNAQDEYWNPLAVEKAEIQQLLL